MRSGSEVANFNLNGSTGHFDNVTLLQLFYKFQEHSIMSVVLHKTDITAVKPGVPTFTR